MPKSFIEVQDEYNDFRSRHPETQLQLGDFAKQVDQVQGVQERTEAYNDAWYKRADAFVDRGFQATGLPAVAGDVAGAFGGGFDTLVGTNIEPTVRRLGQDLPRMTAEAVMTIPEAASVAGAPVAAATWLNRANTIRKILGYGGSALGGYAQTESPIGAAISAGSLGLSNKLLLPAARGGVDVGGRVTGAIRDRLGIGGEVINPALGSDLASATPTLVHSADPILNRLAEGGGVAASAGTQLGINEATRQAQMSVGPNAVPLFGEKLQPEFGRGNIDLSHRPQVRNDDGTVSTVRSITITEDGKAVLIPTVSEDGRIMSNSEAVDQYHKTGRYLGKFGTENEANTYAEQLHQQQAGLLNRTNPRNPFTAENIASNVAGLAPFAVHGGLSLAHATGFDVRQAKPFVEWMKNRRKATEKTLTEPSDMRTAIDVTSKEFSDKDVSTATQTVTSLLSAAQGSEKEGLVEDATRRRAEAASILRRLGKTEADLPTAQQDMKEVRVQADTGLAMASPEALVEFVKKVNGVIDFWNENRAKLESGEITPKQVTAERTAAQSVHPEARSTVVTERLQEKGLLPRITYDWLKSERYVTEEQLGSTDHAFVNDVLAQKVANRLLDSVPEALKKEAMLPVGETAQSKEALAGQKAADDLYVRAVRAIGTFPLEYQAALTKRTIEVTREPVNTDKYPGVPAHMFPHWVDALEKAAGTYNPVDQTIQLSRGPENIGVLWGAPGAGKKFVPGYTALTPGEGGKLRGKWYKEKSAEAVPETLGNLPIEEGEIVPTAPLTEEQKGKWSAMVPSLTNEQAWNLIRDPIFGRGRSMASDFHETNAKLIVEALPDFMKKKGEEVSPAGKALVAAWEATGKKMPGTELAKLQNTFFAILKSHMGFADAPDLGRKEVAVRRAGEIVQKMLDPKAVEVAKGWKGPLTETKNRPAKFDAGDGDVWVLTRNTDPNNPGWSVHQLQDGTTPVARNDFKTWDEARAFVGNLPEIGGGGSGPLAMAAQGTEGEPSLVTFAAPVRLRRWAAAPSGGFSPDSLGQVPSQGVKNLLTKLGITKDEMSIYEAAGLDKMLSAKKVPVEALAKWMEEKTPRVEVKTGWQENETDPRSVRHNWLVHNVYDTLSATQRHTLDDVVNGGRTVEKWLSQQTGDYANFTGERLSALKEYVDVTKDLISNPPSRRTTAENNIPFYPDIAPKSSKDMPGAVTILVRVPDASMKKPGRTGTVTGPLFTGHHFGSHDVNVLVSVRGYEEHLPDGRKVFHVFEKQSDWDQMFAVDERAGNFSAQWLDERHQQQQKIFTSKKDAWNFVNDKRETYYKVVPILRASDELALKAAIAHAREIGADSVAISDAETAMMTEGHDRAARADSVYSVDKVKPGEWYVYNTETRQKLAGPFKSHVEGNNYVKDNFVKISQEPGMRAAYDSRLPKTMEKLTGAAGEPVNFGPSIKAQSSAGRDYGDVGGVGKLVGSPVFKDSAGNPKTSITARLYPISAAPSEFSAFGYSKPMAAQAAAEVGGARDVFSGTPGAFAPDVLRTIAAAVDRHFGTKGYSGDMRTMMHAAAMAIVHSMRDVPTDFYKLGDKVSFGLANEVAGRGKVGLGVEPIAMEDSTHFVHRVLTTLTHELAHIDDFVHFGGLRNTDAYSEERARQLMNIRTMYGVLDSDQRTAILTTLDESLTPPGFRSSLRENPAQMQKAATNVDEFSASVMSLVTQSLLFGKTKGLKTALETLDYSPIEVQEYGQYQYRAIRDVLQSMQDTLADPSIRASVAKASIATGDPFILSKAFSAVVETAMQASRVREGTKMVAEAREMVKNMVPGAGMQEPMIDTDAVWTRRQKDVESTHGTEAFMQGPYAMARAIDAMDAVKEQALGIAKGKSTKLGVWSNWFTPFANVMDEMRRRGVELARPVADLLGDTESAMRRLHSDIMAPLLKHEKDGTVNYDGEHTFVRGMKDSRPQVKLGFNEVSQWQNAHAGKPMFNEVNGELVPITEARSEWEKMRKKYSLADQQAIVAGSVAWDKIGQNEGGTVLSTLKESAQLRVAGLLMGKDRTMGFYPAKASGQQIVEAYLTNNRAALAAIPPQLLRSIDTIMSGPEGFVENFFTLKQKFDAAPGWRTTQLPGDWVVMYTKAGETKFASAPSEEQAKYVRNRVVQQGGTQIGEIVNRKDMRGKYAEFDDPDTVLLKFSKVEGKAWERVVEDIRKTEGDAVADNVASMYTPGAESLSDIEKRSFRRYMVEKKGQVDLENLDFLDAGLARVSRLAASVAFKLHGQTKDLLLNDPSVRNNIDFKARVNKQWDHITSPTGEMTQKMKAMGSAYYMGLNLSSMAFEGTQSVSTVVPMLISTNKEGGVVKAYNQLRQALADSFKVTHSEDWKRIGKAAFDKQEAARREGTVASLTPEEEKWGGYYRAVQNGDIGHGYIADMGYSRGAKAQELAKFGQGDYGPTPWTKVVTNGMYNAAQAMLGFYGVVSKYNDKIAFFAGLNQGIEQAMTGDELYYHTKNFKTMTTFGGGKANAIGAVQAKDPHIRSALGLAATLQTYGLGMVATYMKFAKESINADGSLSPQERRQAVKAFTTMLATQVATAGVLGVPFAAAAMTMIEKATGQPINQMVRQGVADLTDSPEWTEGILNGIGNQMFGLDISSRIGTSTILGTSAYRGFSLQDMLGPFPSIAQNMVKGLNYFGQNEPLRAARELVPQAFKTGFALADSHAKYGDYAIRDGQENLVYTPTAGQNIARAFGFRSREESLKRSASSMTHEADVRSLQTTDQARDDVARRLLSGDPQSARLYAQNMRSADPTVDVRDVLRGVMEKAVGMTQERDLLASGPRGNAAERQSIVASFGPGANTRHSEVGAMRLRTQLAAQLGMPDLMPSGKAWTRAAVVDAIVQRTGVARSQALATVEAMGM